MKKYTCPSVLTIAGFDGSGGAGIQADIKTFSALGCFATSALTALPVQNTQGVRKIYPIPESAVAEQIEAIMDDIFPQAVKIGMVHTPQLVETIVNTLAKYPKIPVVFDPVMVATSGHRLIEEETVNTIINKLFPIADVITPNMDEAAILAKAEVKTLEDMQAAGKLISGLGCKSILLKGGHQESDIITSLFYDETGQIHSFETEKFKTNNTHGSGCTLSSAIAAYLAQGNSLYDSVSLGQQYVFEAIKSGKDFKTGHGNGPLNHFFNPKALIKYDMV
ncbi:MULTISPECIES: bifunctional hydroxymethylpyrimidine kinase/phosphomethylpyrimidine kinase [Elizabethkingia]|uniref:hydroxymethylpyrimidine kinase n=1 Tax=Elizabethkingia meningoseptica TaxID=238 RepID=A0A1T3F8H1_ELIME|nr:MULTISPECIES: bifunctional hydroxymethylpyrimidine kinase/phosphomethylpyrimidine kinase [Elizabethkingia]AQX14133.1 bifunctional hydroxymethylpyrimidine kinase/phosphomethylpyrimidine kinase [Elizabethkingia meningoseptica]MBG0515960.1 bifunctional hydroxymethylpyrimidine kinase/phosphomethylpyrimidine kinase [Elizabethkingia meningoseptica]MDE5435920.1 bifunctional hydroxymethylpyrimidine kinase/phosphomethylpyrimidine kinase [Elizabethkingia meningoseptica]MDE5480551.1 bifunctional hydrox